MSAPKKDWNFPYLDLHALVSIFRGSDPKKYNHPAGALRKLAQDYQTASHDLWFVKREASTSREKARLQDNFENELSKGTFTRASYVAQLLTLTHKELRAIPRLGVRGKQRLATIFRNHGFSVGEYAAYKDRLSVKENMGKLVLGSITNKEIHEILNDLHAELDVRVVTPRRKPCMELDPENREVVIRVPVQSQFAAALQSNLDQGIVRSPDKLSQLLTSFQPLVAHAEQIQQDLAQKPAKTEAPSPSV